MIREIAHSIYLRDGYSDLFGVFHELHVGEINLSAALAKVQGLNDQHLKDLEERTGVSKGMIGDFRSQK